MDVRISWKYFFGLAILTVLVGSGISAASNSGITIHSGTLDMSGNDIEDAGTTIWDASNGYVPEAQMQTANLVWGDLGIAKSDVSASDVGLGNVENEAQVAENGDDMTGNLNMTGNNLYFVDEVTADQGGTPKEVRFNDDVFIEDDLTFSSSTDGAGSNITGLDYIGSDPDSFIHFQSINSDMKIVSLDSIEFYSDGDEDGTNCVIDEGGDNNEDITCDGSKNWVHTLNTTFESVYTAQESPMVRAVYEGNTTVASGRVNVSLPSHFEKTVSDSKPMLRVQATPYSLATVAVTERSDSWIVIEASKDVRVDYRVTGIREGYEDKQVVREKPN